MRRKKDEEYKRRKERERERERDEEEDDEERNKGHCRRSIVVISINVRRVIN